jgi:hypothetical protein
MPQPNLKGTTMTFDISPSILPFFDAYTVFVIVLMGFVFLELTYNLGQNFDKKRTEEQKGFFGRATDIEKLLWFVVFGFIIYFIPVIGLSNATSVALNTNPISAIILSNLHTSLFSQFFKLNSVWNLLGTNENLFASTLLLNIFWYFVIIFLMSLVFYAILKHEKTNMSLLKTGNALGIYLGVSSLVALIYTATSYLLYFTVSVVIILVSFILYTKYKANALKNTFISRNKTLILYIALSILFALTIYSVKYIGNLYNNIAYFLLIGLNFFFIIALLSVINKTNNKFDEILFVGLVAILVVGTQYSLFGFASIMPNGHKTLHNINVTDFSYQITGYISPNNASKISAIDTVAFTGYVNFSKGLNYSYLSTYNNTDFTALGSFYQANPIYDIKNGIIPPGILVNESTARCSFKAGINCYSYTLVNTTYIIIQRNSTTSPSSTPVTFFYNLNTNSSSVVRRLHYNYLPDKSCNIQKCELNLTLSPILNTAVVLQSFNIDLPNNYSNLTIIVSNTTCQKSTTDFNTYYSCYTNSGDNGEIMYPNATTNYLEITSWIIYNNNSLNLQINMSN